MFATGHDATTTFSLIRFTILAGPAGHRWAPPRFLRRNSSAQAVWLTLSIRVIAIALVNYLVRQLH